MPEVYQQPVEDVLEARGVDAARGLSDDEAARRREEHGPNRLREARRKSPWTVLADQFRSLIIAILFVTAVLSAVVGELIQSAAILVAIFINTGVGFFTELKAGRSIAALRELERTTARVRRSGKARDIDAARLVPGDIVLLDAGEVVPADLRLTDTSALRIDEAALTGESVPVGKTVDVLDGEKPLAERVNLAFKGTSVANGSGEGVVVGTGMDTELGRISALAEEAEGEETPLEKRLDRLGRRLLAVIAVVAAVIAGIGILAGRDLQLMIETGIALVVAAVPEGLPIVASVALARGLWRLAERNALVEKLSAVETLGAANVICTDKTGTLTLNRMRLTRLGLAGGEVTVPEEEGGAFTRDGERMDAPPDGALRAALEVAVLCNAAELGKESERDSRGAGDPLEIALLAGGQRAGIERDALLEDCEEVRREEFDPEVMMMATFHDTGDGVRVAVKGAPEAVIGRSARVMTEDGQTRALDETGRQEWLDRNEAMAAEGLRAIALAVKTADSAEADPYDGLTLIGLAGLLDPARTEVREAVLQCRAAGIETVMVTGDQPETARAIGEAVGLVDDGTDVQVVLGSDLKPLEEMSEEERQSLLGTHIFARVDPEQKLDLIELYQDAGRVVAMTGDGVNDAPALKKADIGVAMGQRGTEVARQAAEMVLRDDSFSSIVTAIRQGRTIFGNIRKFVLYMLSGNTAEIFAVSLVALLNAPLPLLPLQILYINIVSDVFPALALGVGESPRDVMKRPPRDPEERVLTPRLWGVIAGYGALIGGSVLAVFWYAFELGMTQTEAVTVSFLAFGFGRLWHVFNMRDRDTGLFRNEVVANRYVWGALGIGVALMLAATYVPGLNTVLNVTPPGAEGWMLILVGSIAPLIVGQGVKLAAARFSAAPSE